MRRCDQVQKTTSPFHTPNHARTLLRSDRFDLELKINPGPDDNAAALEGHVEPHAPVLTVDGGLCLERRALVTPWVLALALEGGVQLHLLGNAVHAQVALHEVRVAVFSDRRAS